MPNRFEWVPDVSRGAWLRPMEAEPFGSILSIVPRGFDAYARVFHRFERDRPRSTNTWHGVDERSLFDEADDPSAILLVESTTWAAAAASFGTVMHTEAQSASLTRLGAQNRYDVVAPDGWRYQPTRQGSLDVASMAAAATVLARHTSTPDAGIAAIWEGWGGLVGSQGVSYTLTELTDGHTDPISAAGTAYPGYPRPESGLLSSEIATGPRFDLHGNTGRHYLLFEAGADDFTEPSWLEHAPWVENTMWPQSPSILWPDDHAWVLATEIDFDSTLIAGSATLIRELTQTPGLEAHRLRPDADLSSNGDRLNRPAERAHVDFLPDDTRM